MALAAAVAQVTPAVAARAVPGAAAPVPTLDDFAVLCEVGRGAFGRVVLARCKATGELRALKSVPKVRLVTAGSDAIRHIHDEAAVQRSIDHPFALALRGAFQDDTTVYLVTDHCPGGTLHAVLGRFGRLNAELATFYAAQLVDVLAHLHTQDVAFRDIKPENALIDEKGYLRLADFGLARRVDGDDGRCRTRCGTPLYAAPEVISGKSHGRPVDAWALGCVLVEMLTGRPPFVGSTVAQVEALVLEANLNWLTQLEEPVMGLCWLLLAKKPENRARCAAAKLHTAFAAIGGAALRAKTTAAPYLPDTARDVLGASTPTTKGFADSFSSFASFSTLNDRVDSPKKPIRRNWSAESLPAVRQSPRRPRPAWDQFEETGDDACHVSPDEPGRRLPDGRARCLEHDSCQGDCSHVAAALAKNVGACPLLFATPASSALTAARCVLRALPDHAVREDACIPVHWGARGFGVVVCAAATCPDAVRCAARRRRVAEAIKRAPPDAPCACVAGACEAAGLARAFARLNQLLYAPRWSGYYG
jgi:serine/threonine protein kinase